MEDIEKRVEVMFVVALNANRLDPIKLNKVKLQALGSDEKLAIECIVNLHPNRFLFIPIVHEVFNFKELEAMREHLHKRVDSVFDNFKKLKGEEPECSE